MFENWPNRSRESDSIVIQEFDGKVLSDVLHEHDMFELCFIYLGKGKWQVGASEGAFAAGTLLLCPPRVLHAWRGGEGGGAGNLCSGIVLRFRRETLPAGLLKLPEMRALGEVREALSEPLVFEVVDRERLRARLRSVDRAQGVLRLARFYVALELISSFSFSQVAVQQVEENGLSAREMARANELKRFLAERFSGSVSRAEAARLVGLDEAAFSRFFRRAMSTTFVDYIGSLRVRHAAALLGNRRDLTLDEVAAKSGFGSLPSLHRQFKKRLGTTPDSYRKAANSEFLAP
ncbi:AraC family transcriptional regulator [Pelagicoccus sp. SDUM812002]|uniref:AraC family transcriptional regulator n=1 Tax=Pelagicoccus sp. SDUM812002 TaxID=3041266 RepID=UPI0034E1A28B